MKRGLYVAVISLAMASCENGPPLSSRETAPAADHAAGMQAAASAPATASPAGAAAKVAIPASPLVDAVMPGDEQAEKNHNLKGENDETGDWSDRTYRHADGGWFSWDLKVIPGQPNDLVVTYWGSDQRTFDIQVDGERLVTERLQNDHPEEFFEKTHPISASMIGNKQKITVKFVNPTSYAGGVFGLKIMRPAAGSGAATGTR